MASNREDPIILDDLDQRDLTAIERWFIRRFRCAECRGFRMGLFSSSRRCAKCVESGRRQRAERAAGISESLKNTLCDLFGKTNDRKLFAAAIAAAESAGLNDSRPARAEAYCTVAAHLAIKNNDQITDEDLTAMERVQDLLGLGDKDVSDVKRNLQRMQRIAAIGRGELPSIQTAIPLQKNEIAHFCFAADLYKEQVVSREYVGGSEGLSFRVARGVYYRIGSHRGRSVSHSAIVKLATGELILTSKRLIFSGEKAFSIPLAKILHFVPFCDGLSITKDSTAQNNKPWIFICPDPEMTNLALSACLNQAQ